MKRKVSILLLLFIFVLTACNSNTEPMTSEDKSNPHENEEEKVEEQKEENSSENEGESLEIEVETEDQNEPKYKVSDNWSIVPIEQDENEEIVLLTIDDTPDKHAVEMAKTLKELDANAIFFVNGHFLDTPEEKAMLKEIYEMGFVIGNHTYSHGNLQNLSEEEQREEIVRVNDQVEEIIGERPVFFRAPHGANTDYSKQVAEEEGMTLMNWSFGYDWNQEYMSKDAIADIMVNTELLGNGSNLLMHDREWTAQALGDIVTGLRGKGYEIVDPTLIQTK